MNTNEAQTPAKMRYMQTVAAKRVVACIAYVTSLVFVAGSAWSAEPFAAPRAAEPVTTSPAAGLVQVTFSLLLVLAAVFAAAWVVRRLKGFGRVAPGAIEVIADVALGPKERAVLVQVGKQQLLIGVAPGNVNTLHVLAEPIETASRTPALSQATAQQSTSGATQIPPHLQFKTILKRSLGL